MRPFSFSLLSLNSEGFNFRPFAFQDSEWLSARTAPLFFLRGSIITNKRSRPEHIVPLVATCTCHGRPSHAFHLGGTCPSAEVRSLNLIPATDTECVAVALPRTLIGEFSFPPVGCIIMGGMVRGMKIDQQWEKCQTRVMAGAPSITS
jgi:hypothetical protein